MPTRRSRPREDTGTRPSGVLEPAQERAGLSRESRIVARTGAAVARFVPRNYYLGVLNGAMVRLRTSLLDPSTVLALLVVHLTGREDLAGLLFSAEILGIAAPQVLLPGIIAAMPRKRPVYVISTVGRTVAMAMLFALMLTLDRWDPRLVFGLLLLGTLLLSAAVGIGVPVFFDVVAKTIPPDRRGGLMAWRWFWGGIFGLAGGLLVRYLLRQQDSVIPLVRTFQILMGLGAVAGMVAAVSFCFVEEPKGKVAGRRTGAALQIRWGLKYLRVDRNLRKFLLFRVAMSLAGCSALYAGLYWKQGLGLDHAVFGYFIVAQVVGELSNVLVMGRVSDRHGNRSVLVKSSLGFAAVPLLIGAATVVPVTWGPIQPKFLVYLATYVLIGIAGGGVMIGGMNYPLEIAPEARRPTYLGLIYASSALLAFIPGIVGLMLPYMGYGGLFVLSAGAAGVAALAASTLQEPRRALTMMR